MPSKFLFYRPRFILAALVLLAVLFQASLAGAYIGPGAGFAVVGSFMAFFFAFLSALLSMLVWPARALYIFIRRKLLKLRPQVKRVIVLGLDGLDPRTVHKMFQEDKLPNLKKLKEEGYFRPLKSTTPSISPVAWSTFMTGVNPGKHAIFDFLAPDRKAYLPVLSSSKIGNVERTVKIGKYVIPLGSPEIRLLRKSAPFWKILGDNFIFSQILRVPITFPPEKHYGTNLAAMCVPDLRGSQGSFTYFTSAKGENARHTGGIQVTLESDGNGGFVCDLPGPDNPLVPGVGEMKIPLKLKKEKDDWKLILPDAEVALAKDKYTDYVDLTFKAGLGVAARGIGRFRLLATEPDLELYLTPINIDPRSPAMPISHPSFFSSYIAKLQGPYATLGLNEDTWSLNERVLEEGAFLEQVWDIHEEREKMFLRAIDTTSKGCVVCVFDATDRVQHMFMRYEHPDHPANAGKDTQKYKNAIPELYERADELVGKVMAKRRKGDVLIVMSDHGFTSFKRGMNLNSWLWKEGYLATRDGKPSGELYENVDWENTRAYALGLAGMFLNLKGREARGVVEKDEAQALRAEIAAKLEGIEDKEGGGVAIEKVHLSGDAYWGPYAGQGPDLVPGFRPGWRVSWDGAMGVVNDVVFEDNLKAWSGDHCVDERFVPGVLFCDRDLECKTPWIGDVAPTILEWFGVPIPAHMDGKSLLHPRHEETKSDSIKEKAGENLEINQDNGEDAPAAAISSASIKDEAI